MRSAPAAPPAPPTRNHPTAGSGSAWSTGPGSRGAAGGPSAEALLKQLRAEVEGLKEDSWQFEAPRHAAS